MSVAAIMTFALAQGATALPPCRDGRSECKPWERAWNNPYDQFDSQPAKPVTLGRGPHTLIIMGASQVTRIEYSSGVICEDARDKVKGQARVVVFCVPR